MKLLQQLTKKTQIHRYNIIENILSIIIGCLLTECVLLGYLINFINNMHIKESYSIPVMQVEYITSNEDIIEKEPIDIIEESEEEIIQEVITQNYPITSLNSKLGTVQGPQEIEKYYNLPMDNVIINMRKLGYTEEDYPYYITDDGIKMLGDFIIVAADLDEYPRGTVVQTTLGQGLVCDHCETPDIIDLAVEW